MGIVNIDAVEDVLSMFCKETIFKLFFVNSKRTKIADTSNGTKLILKNYIINIQLTMSTI